MNGYTRMLHHLVFYRQATKRVFWDKMCAVVAARADKKRKKWKFRNGRQKPTFLEYFVQKQKHKKKNYDEPWWFGERDCVDGLLFPT